MVTLKVKNEDTAWHQHRVEEAKFSKENLKYGNVLLFVRKTYEMMDSVWPSPTAFG